MPLPDGPVEIIRSRIAKLQQLEELARDPEMRDVLVAIAIATLNGNRPSPQTETAQHAEAPPNPAATPLGPTDAVKSILPRFSGREFTHVDVLDALTRVGYRFTAKNPGVAVSGILRRLNGEVVIEDERSSARTGQRFIVFATRDTVGFL